MAVKFTVDDLHNILQKRLDAMRGTQPIGGNMVNDPMAGIREAIRLKQQIGPPKLPKV